MSDTEPATFDFNKILRASYKYGDAHRMLLNLMLERGTMTERAFCAHFIRCYAENEDLEEINYKENLLELSNFTEDGWHKMLKQLVDVINKKTRIMGVRLLRANDDVACKRTIVLASERGYSAALAAASQFSKDEQVLIIRWIETMVDPDNENEGCIHIDEALKSARLLPVPLTMAKAQTLLDELESGDWITLEGDLITLGMRGLMELGPLLRARFRSEVCCLCTNVILRKKTVINCDKCEALVHIHCWNKFTESQTSSAASVGCPGMNCSRRHQKSEIADRIDAIRAARLEALAPNQRPGATQARTQLTHRRRSRDDDDPDSRQLAIGRLKSRKSAEKQRQKQKAKKKPVVAADNDGDGREETPKLSDSDDDDDVFAAPPTTQSRKQPPRRASTDQPRKKSREDEEEDED